MAYLAVIGKSPTVISLRIDGLSAPVQDYDGFRFWCTSDSTWYDWYTNTYTFSGLTPNTAYTFLAEALYGGTWYPVTGTSETTDPLPVPDIPSAPTLVSRGETSLTIQWGSSTYANYYIVKYYDFTLTPHYETVYGTSTTITGLSPGTSYYLSVAAVNDSGNSGYSSENTATTKPYGPSYVNIDVNVKNITITFTKGDGSYQTNINCSWLGGTIDDTTTDTSFSFTVPDFDTAYSFQLQSATINGVTSDWSSSYYFTSGNLLPTVPSAPTITTRGGTFLELGWGASVNATSYTLRYYNGTYHEISGITETSYLLTDLIYGTSYLVSVKGVNGYGSSAYSSENVATTLPQTPTISQGAVLVNSITINIGSVSGGYSHVRVSKYDNSGNFLGYLDGSPNSPVTFTGLSASTTYKFDAVTILGSLTSGTSNQLTIATLSARPSNWSWSYSIGSGSPVMQTTSLGGYTYAYIMTYTEWNNFTYRVNAFRIYKGYSNYSFTSAAPDSNATPAIFNEAVAAINAMGFSIPSMGSYGVSAAVLNAMRDALNSIE